MTGSRNARVDVTGDLSSLSPEPAAQAQLARLQRALGDRFVFGRELGRGGMAHVYLARDVVHNRAVAIKVLRPEFAAEVAAARFLREIDIEGRLLHPNILPIFESGSADGELYFTMPFVEGDTLRERLRKEGAQPLDRAIAITRDVGSALDYAHSHDVIHRDIKPANILLSEQGAIVADFGIARAMTVAAGEQITDSGFTLGTPEYMSPEQGTGERRLGPRSDVYAMGCVLYEMLAGEPPFTGPTSQAIVARHCQERPPSLLIVRPSLPPGVQRVVETALAKVPADRFATASYLVEALVAAAAEGERALETRWMRASVRVVLGAGLAVAAVVGVGFGLLRPPRHALETNRIVVFPLRVPGSEGVRYVSGEEVATYIGYALDGTRPLKWLEGAELLDDRRSADLSRLTLREAHTLAREARAGFFIDGSILGGPDSATVVLRLYSVAGDSLVRRAGASGPIAPGSLPRLGLRAVGDLLPALLEPGRRIDLSALGDRHPTAVANFLQGEREYRRMQFAAALEHYRNAVRQDSAFALAALRGAQAANWLGRFGEDTELIDVAVRREELLPPMHVPIARGLNAYLTGAGDSAVHYLERALAIDSTSHGVWTLLAEVYSHLLPARHPSDSLARAALRMARRAEPDFAPALLMLEEIALREGKVSEALALREELRRAGADTTHALQREVMLRCVRDGAPSINWIAAAARDARSLLATGKLLSQGAAQPECARAAFTAVLESDSASVNQRWGALFGLQSLLIAIGRSAEIAPVFASERAAQLPAWSLYLLDGSAGVGFEREAAAAAESKGTAYAMMTSPTLWLLGGWEARRGNVTRVREITQALRLKADSFPTRREVLLVRVLVARLALLEGDTSEAVGRLRELAPSAPRYDIAWQPWEALAGERMLLAELLHARGDFQEAIRVATQLDAGEPVVHLLYLRPSLSLRVRAAGAMGDAKLTSLYERRLSKLRA